MNDFEIVKIFCIFAKKKVMEESSKKIHSFKHFKYGKFEIHLYLKTAIISWKRKVDEDYDESYSYKHLHKVVADKLREQDIFNKNFILLQEIFPAEYTQLPPEKETMELYIQFKENLTTKEKKAEVKQFLEMLLFEN